MKAIKVVSPTRVDLAGGTLDLWPIYNFIPKAKTINLAIDIFTTCYIEASNDNSIAVEAKGVNLYKEIADLGDYLKEESNKTDFFYPHLEYFRPSPCKISFSSDSPVGGGLGGSSSLTISIFSALAAFTGREIKDPNKLVEVAHNMESFLLKTPTGTQDYYPAYLGGALCLHHQWDGTRIERLDLAINKMKEHFLLVYTGSPHHSGMNNWAVLKALIDGDKKTLESLKEIAIITDDLHQTILEKNWLDIPSIFQREYVARSKLSPTFTNKNIKDLESLALGNGAEAIKICGAGGGGCVFLWADKNKHENLTKVLNKNNYKVLKAKPFSFGTKVSVDEH